MADNGQIVTKLPFHGTQLSTPEIVTKIYTDPTKRPLFTVLDDGEIGSSAVRGAYQGPTGTSLPVALKLRDPNLDIYPEYEYKKLKVKTSGYEREPLTAENGLHGSTNYGDVGELASYFETEGPYAQRVKSVSDTRATLKGNTGQRINEYNLGTGTPGVSFLLNTMEFLDPKKYGAFRGFKKGGNLNFKYNKSSNNKL